MEGVAKTDKRQDSTTQAERYENKRLRRDIHHAKIRATPQEEDTMANQEQLALLKQGIIVFWNTWRREHPSLRPDLSGARLWGANLSGAEFSFSELEEANLSRARLKGALLIKANLSRAKLSQADLSGANLTQAYLEETDLSGANLSGAYLYGAD